MPVTLDKPKFIAGVLIPEFIEHNEDLTNLLHTLAWFPPKRGALRAAFDAGANASIRTYKSSVLGTAYVAGQLRRARAA